MFDEPELSLVDFSCDSIRQIMCQEAELAQTSKEWPSSLVEDSREWLSLAEGSP